MSTTLPALGNTLLRSYQTLQGSSSPPPDDLQIVYLTGFRNGYTKGYLDGLYAFQPLVPKGFVSPYRTAVTLLKKECEAKLDSRIKDEYKFDTPPQMK